MDMVLQDPFSWTIASLRDALQTWGCNDWAINAVLCEVFADAYCSGLPPAHDPIFQAINDLIRKVGTIVGEEHTGIEAGGIAIAYNPKTGVQYKDRCGTNVERQMSCRAAAPTLPALPSPSFPAAPVAMPTLTVDSPVGLTVEFGDIVIVWPSQITIPSCEFWPGDANCS